MFDLDTLAALNDQACRESQAPDPEVLPLSVLADRLMTGPPSLGALMDLFEQTRHLGDFLHLIREYLPDREREIMAGSMEDRVETFRRLFSTRYFPLADNFDDDLSLENFCAYIPIEPRGISYDDYHNFDGFRDGLQMMVALIVYPYVDSAPEPCSHGLLQKPYEGGRIAIIEHVANLVGRRLATEIPEKGWEAGELHRLTDGTEYQGIAYCADWLCQSTGYGLLDVSYDEYSGEEWSRDAVDALTRDWPKVEEIEHQIYALADWLEESPSANFGQLLHFLLGRSDHEVPKEQLPLPLDENGQVDTTKLTAISGKERPTVTSHVSL